MKKSGKSGFGKSGGGKAGMGKKAGILEPNLSKGMADGKKLGK